MREIKFRAVIPTINKMCFKGRGLTLGEIRRLDESYFREDVTWLEYTGLKDKNGKEIYEADIIKLDGMGFIEYEIGEVVWSRLNTYGAHEPDPLCWNLVGYTRASGESISDGDGQPIISELDTYLSDGGEVIGNIYENPELLEEK